MKILFLLFFMTLSLHARNIVGRDERVQVLAHEDNFSRSLGLLEKSSGGKCSGTLISRKHVITNGHCVITKKTFPSTTIDPSEILFYPGLLGDGQMSAPAAFGKRIFTFPEYLIQGTASLDIAVIELTDPVSLPTQPLTLVGNPVLLKNLSIQILGYPGDKDFGSLWKASGVFSDYMTTRKTIIHNVDTSPGTSGSLIRAQIRGKWEIVAIHRGGIFHPRTANEAIPFTQEIFDAINRWIRN